MIIIGLIGNLWDISSLRGFVIEGYVEIADGLATGWDLVLLGFCYHRR